METVSTIAFSGLSSEFIAYYCLPITWTSTIPIAERKSA